MKNNRMNTQFFNFRLFLEGLKRLRVIGLATAILAVTASAVIPLVYWIEELSATYDGPFEIEPEFLCVPAGAMVAFAPFFFFVLFSFLQKRKESDFFHAIPYTRTCVYNSFIAAALVFVFAIQLACGLVAGILWGVAPHLTVDLGAMAAYVAMSMLAAAMISAFMMLALSVSGTEGSCMLLFALFAGFVRVIAAIFLGCLDSINILYANGMWETSFLSPLWFLPINIFYYWGDTNTAMAMMYRPSNILYSLAVTLLLFALAGLIYKHRRSEMAGNPAPGKTTQALFRIMFTTLPALLIPFLILMEGGDGALLLVLVVSVLLVYFLYELITTKRPKNLLKIFPGLGIVVGVCFVFTILFYGYRGFLLNEDITADEVKAVSVESNGFDSNSYQGYLASDIRTDDPEIVKTVVAQLAHSQKLERDGSWWDTENQSYYWDRMEVTIRLKGGRTVKRYVIFDPETRAVINQRYMELDEVKDLVFLIPEDREINRIGMEIGSDFYTDYGSTDGEKEMKALLTAFRREFGSLTDAQKLEVMTPAFRNFHYDGKNDPDRSVVLSLRGRMGGLGEYFFSEYIIPEYMPETRGLLLGLWGMTNRDANYFDCGGQSWGGCADDALAALGREAEDSEFSTAFPVLKGHITLVGMGSQNTGNNLDHTFYLEAKDYARFAELLLAASMVHANTEPEDFTATPTTYMMILYTDMDGKYSRIHLNMNSLFDLTAEEYAELKTLLQIGK